MSRRDYVTTLDVIDDGGTQARVRVLSLQGAPSSAEKFQWRRALSERRAQPCAAVRRRI
jgi:hypothetical protein